MQALKDKIIAQGQVLSGNILKVDGFLNQQMDMRLYEQMGRAIGEHFAHQGITKVLTIEASGIALACAAARELDFVPVVFAKKHNTLNRDANFLSTPIFSFTHNVSYDVTIAKRFLSPDDRVLIVDDFLATGEALVGLCKLCQQAGAHVVGMSTAIEKGYQGGGDALRQEGYDVYSLAIVDSMENGTVQFRECN